MNTSRSNGSQVVTEPTEGFGHFFAVVEAGNISAAARELNMPRATLSRKVSELEASLGVQLLHRTTRKLVPTEAGLELYRRGRIILQNALDVRDAVRRLDGIPRGLLRLASLPALGTALEPLLSEYLDRYPETRIEVVAGIEFVNLIEQGIDIAIRAGNITESHLVAHRISDTQVFPVAAPSYLAKYGYPKCPTELIDHECLVDYQRGDLPRLAWPLKQGGSALVKGRLASNDLSLLVAAAVAGRGIALLPTAVSCRGLNTGDLQPVLREQVGYQAPLSLVHKSREFIDPKVRAFIDLAIPFLKTNLEVGPGKWHDSGIGTHFY